jgi:hypothetical protein
MSNNIKKEINKIVIPKSLHERSKKGVFKAKDEVIDIRKKRKKYKGRVLIAVASVLLTIGGFTLIEQMNQPATLPNEDILYGNADGSITIPEIKLPEEDTLANMIGLIVYNNKIYTQTDTEIIPKYAKSLLGEKLGTTKATIDEWSNQDEYSVEFASTIGITDVYSVKGYDKGFRIMTYEERDGKTFAEIYESLNDITIESGEDLFGKLKISNNVKLAHLRYYSDFYYSSDNYRNIADMDLIHSFFNNLNGAKPITQERLPLSKQDYYNDERFRELTVYLNDGTKVRLTLFEGGYIHYGYMPIYFKMDDLENFNNIWVQLPLTD